MTILQVKKYCLLIKRLTEQAKFTYSPLWKAFEKQIKTSEDQGQKQVKTIKDNKKQLANTIANSYIKWIIAFKGKRNI